MSRRESAQTHLAVTRRKCRTWRRFLVLCVCALALPQAGGAVVTEEAGLAAPTVPQEQSPTYVPKQFLIKFKPAVSACAHCLIAQGQSFASVTGSSQLDELNRRYGVVSARSLFIERHSLTTQQAQANWQQTVEAVKARFSRRTRRVVDPQAPVPDLTNVYLVVVNSTEPIEQICKTYAASPYVDYAEPNYLFHAALAPNDPFWPTSGSWGQSFADLWGLKQIQADLAWDLNQGSGTLVAVTDSGFDFTHPDRGATWTNPGEIAGNGLDDDANGFVDDTRGWDFANGDNDPTDDFGHGTHVAGIINAAINNNMGIAGVAPQSTAMILKVLDANNTGPLSAVTEAINYAVAKGADVINMSLSTGGTPIPTPLSLRDVVDLAHDVHGVVVVAAAGNDNRIDVGTQAFGIFPAALNDVITVGANFNAMWNTMETANFSNIGAKIDLVAPGAGTHDPPPSFNPFRAVLSLAAVGATPASTGSGQLLVPPPLGAGTYLRQAGTSQAAPYVSGTAALLLSRLPSLTNEQVRQVLRNSAVDIERPDRDRASGYGRLNALQALNLGSVPIARLSSPLLFSKVKQGIAVEIRGSATSPAVGFASWRVLVKRLQDPSFTQIASGTTPVTDGLFTSWDTSGLTIGQQYVVKLEVQDANAAIANDRVVVYCRTPIERFTVRQLTSTPFLSNFFHNSIIGAVNADGTKVAFYSTADLVPGSNPDSHYQTFRWNKQTGQSQQITFGNGTFVLPSGLSISASGTQVAFMSRHNLLGTNPEQNEELFFFDEALTPPGIKQLTQTTSHGATPRPDISADGQWVAFHMNANLVGRNADLNFEIFRVDTTTSATEQLTDTDAASFKSNVAPSLNADGTKMAFHSNLFSFGTPDVLLLDIALNTLQRIIDADGNGAGNARVNADASLIAFQSPHDLVPPGNGDFNSEVFLANVKTNTLIQVTNSQRNLPLDTIHSVIPVISSDGNRIVFQSTADLDPSIGNPFASRINLDSGEQIYLSDVPTGRLYQVTDAVQRFGTLSTGRPTVSADGTKIAFHSPGDLDPTVGNPDSNVELFLATTIDRPPLLNPIGPKTVMAGQPLAFTVSGSDPDVDPLTFSASNLPTGASFNPATRAFSWTPTGAQVRADPYYVRFVIDDGTFGDMEDVAITVVNDPPVLNPIGNKTVNEGQALQFTVSASDPNTNQTLTLSASNLPPGATFPTAMGTGSVSGTFNWTPSCTGAGIFPNVTFTVSDGALTDSEAITITVMSANCLPTIIISDVLINGAPAASTLPINVNENASNLTFPSLSFRVTASDPDGDTIQLCGRNLPPGAAFNGQTFLTCIQTGAATVSGTFAWAPGSFSSLFPMLGSCPTAVGNAFPFTPSFTVWDAGVGIVGPGFPWPQQEVTINLVRAAVPHPPAISAFAYGQSTLAGFTDWVFGRVGPGKPFELRGGGTCDPDTGTTGLSFAWSYLGSNPAGISQGSLNLSGLNQPTATGTAPAVSQNTTLSFRLQVTDPTSLTSTKDTSILVDTQCFIATAAYGSPLAPELDILRAYRDQMLSRSPLGRSLTEFYYRTSPPIARFIADKPLLRALVRQALEPIIELAKQQLAKARADLGSDPAFTQDPP